MDTNINLLYQFYDNKQFSREKKRKTKRRKSKIFKKLVFLIKIIIFL